MQTVRLYLEEIAGDWFGWIESFPGAYCQGTTPQQAERAVSGALTDYLRWLRSHDEAPPASLLRLPLAEVRVEVLQTHHAHTNALGAEVNGFFPPDERPLDDEALERYLRLLRYAREDLLKAVYAIPPDDRNKAPFGGKSVNHLLKRLADRELCLLTRLRIEPTPAPHKDPIEHLRAIRAEFERETRAFSAHKRGNVFTLDGERWTLRKVMRHALWHERYHAAQIATRSNPVEFMRSIVVDTRLIDAGRHAGRV